MKTFDEIINRTDYVTMSATLREKAQEIAQKIAQKMYSLELDCQEGEKLHPAYAVTINEKNYVCVNTVTHCRLVLVRGGNAFSLNDDLNGTPAGHDEFIDFLNDALEFLNKLDEAETFRVAETEKALDKASELNGVNNDSLLQLFSDFLIRENVFGVFCERLRDYSLLGFVKDCQDHPEGLVVSAFRWYETKEGYKFWNDISCKWMKYFREKKIMKAWIAK